MVELLMDIYILSATYPSEIPKIAICNNKKTRRLGCIWSLCCCTPVYMTEPESCEINSNEFMISPYWMSWQTICRSLGWVFWSFECILKFCPHNTYQKHKSSYMIWPVSYIQPNQCNEWISNGYRIPYSSVGSAWCLQCRDCGFVSHREKYVKVQISIHSLL